MRILLVLACSFLTVLSSAYAEGVVRLERCKVLAVSASPKRLVLVISGECQPNLLNRDKAAIWPRLENTVVVFKRFAFDATPEEEPPENAPDSAKWKAFCDSAKSFEGNTIKGDCYKPSYVVEDFCIPYIAGVWLPTQKLEHAPASSESVSVEDRPRIAGASETAGSSGDKPKQHAHVQARHEVER